MRQGYDQLKSALTSGNLTGTKLNNFLDSTYCQMMPLSQAPTNAFSPMVESTCFVANTLSADNGKIYRRASVTNSSSGSSSDWEFIGKFVSGSGITDHSALSGRENPDQHTIASITNLQVTLDSKANAADLSSYLPKTFASPQVVTYTGQGQFVFANAGELVAQNLAVGANQNNFVSLMPDALSVRFVGGSSGFDSRLVASNLGARTWTLPDASGTIALTSQIPSVTDYIKKDGSTATTATIPFANGITVQGVVPGYSTNTRMTMLDGWIAPMGATTNFEGLQIIAGNVTAIWAKNGIWNNSVKIQDNQVTATVDGNQMLALSKAADSSISGGVNMRYYAGTGNHLWDNGIGGSTSKYQFNGSAQFADEIRGPAVNIGNTVSYANMPATTWQTRLGTSSSGAVDDLMPARWTNRVSGTNATGYVLRWLSESRSGASMGAEVERMSLTNGALTLSPNSGQGLVIASSVSGSQVKFTSSDTVNGWRHGISSDAAADYLIVNDTLGNIPLRILRSNNEATFLGNLVAPTARLASTPTGTIVAGGWLGLDASGNVVKATAASGGNPFNQSLNTTDSPTFQDLTINGSLAVGGIVTSAGASVGGNLAVGGTITASSTASGTIVAGGWLGLNSSGVLVKASAPNPFDQSLNTTDSPTFAGLASTGSVSGTGTVAVSGPAATERGFQIRTGSSSRWVWRADSAPESGSNNGSNFELVRYNDAGAQLGVVMNIVRSTGAMTIYNALSLSGTLDASSGINSTLGANNFGPSSATRASLNIGAFGAAKSSPVDGDLFKTAADSLAIRMATNTRTFTFNEKSQTFSGTQTFNLITATNTITGRQLAQTRQTSATATGAITWTLTSGGTMDLTANLTGAVTMNITAPAAGGRSCLFVSQGTTPQTVTLSLTGVSWILTGPNGTIGTNTITIPAADFIANKTSCVQIYWSTATRAIVTVT